MSKISLTQDKLALVPDGDYGWLSAVRWYAARDLTTQSFYAQRNAPTGRDHPRYRTLKMHNAIWEHHNGLIPAGRTVDHVNRDTLDNRLSNLRLATPSQQQQNKGLFKNNTSGHRGVGWHKGCEKWQARIGVDGKRIHLGYFDDKDDADRAYDDVAMVHHDRSFAQTNHP